MPLGGYRGYR